MTASSSNTDPANANKPSIVKKNIKPKNPYNVPNEAATRVSSPDTPPDTPKTDDIMSIGKQKHSPDESPEKRPATKLKSPDTPKTNIINKVAMQKHSAPCFPPFSPPYPDANYTPYDPTSPQFQGLPSTYPVNTPPYNAAKRE